MACWLSCHAPPAEAAAHPPHPPIAPPLPALQPGPRGAECHRPGVGHRGALLALRPARRLLCRLRKVRGPSYALVAALQGLRWKASNVVAAAVDGTVSRGGLCRRHGMPASSSASWRMLARPIHACCPPLAAGWRMMRAATSPGASRYSGGMACLCFGSQHALRSRPHASLMRTPLRTAARLPADLAAPPNLHRCSACGSLATITAGARPWPSSCPGHAQAAGRQFSPAALLCFPSWLPC